LVEILGPATEKPIDRGDPQFWTFSMFVRRRRVVNPFEQAPDGLPRRAGADKRHPVLAIEPTDRITKEVETFLGSRTNRVLVSFTVNPSRVISCRIVVSTSDPFPGRQQMTRSSA